MLTSRAGLWAVLAVAICTSLCNPVHASPSTAAASLATQDRPRVALVLSGGGARGFAHVGVLQALEKARVPIDMVVGTSMGAIIGGLYASGLSPEALREAILDVDWATLFDQRLPRPALSERRKEQDFEFSPVLNVGFKDGTFRFPQGAVSSRSLELLLRRHTLHTRHVQHFDQLPLPFRALATDMETGQAVLLDHGDLAAALRASMSVPGVFTPLQWEERLLGDGGLVNNLPVDVARDMGADVVIAVNIGTPLAKRDTLDTVLGVTVQMINILTEQNVQRSIATLRNEDLLLMPDLGALTSGDFNQAATLMDQGLAYTESVSHALASLQVDAAHYAQWQSQRQQAHTALTQALPSRVAFVRLEGIDEGQTSRVLRQLNTQAGDALNPDEIERDLSRLVALDDYVRLDYQLSPDPQTGGEGLIYQILEDQAGMNQFRIGLDLQTNFQGQGDFRLRISHNKRDVNRWGAQWRNRLELGVTTALGTELYQPLGRNRDQFTTLYADHTLRKVEWYDNQGDPYALFRQRSTRLGADLGWHLGSAGQWGDVRLGLMASRQQSLLDYINGPVDEALRKPVWTEAGWRLSWVADRLDHANFPQSGHRFTSEWQQGLRRSDSGKTRYQRWEASANQVFSHGPHTWNMYLRLGYSSAAPLGAVDPFTLGGFQQLSGYHTGQISGNHLAFARLGYYQRLPLQPGIARALFAGGTLELGNAWGQQDTPYLRSLTQALRVGSSVYLGADTGIGPIYISLVHAPQGYSGVYFLLGKP